MTCHEKTGLNHVHKIYLKPRYFSEIIYSKIKRKFNLAMIHRYSLIVQSTCCALCDCTIRVYLLLTSLNFSDLNVTC